MQVTSQCRVDAPLAWVRDFLLAGTTQDDVSVEGNVIEVRQHDRLIDLVVRNTLTEDTSGGTLIDVDASLRLLGIARLIGGLFHRRVRRTLERGLDRLPVAIEQALEQQEPELESPGAAGTHCEATGEKRGPIEAAVPPAERGTGG